MKTALFWCMTYLILAYVVYHLVGVMLCYTWEYLQEAIRGLQRGFLRVVKGQARDQDFNALNQAKNKVDLSTLMLRVHLLCFN